MTNGNKPDPRRLRLFVFDLDGTLIDSKLDLILSVNATREEFGLTRLPEERISGFIGDGARTLIERALEEDANKDRVEEALWFFIRYYSEHALDHTTTYPGVVEGLDRLSSDGNVLTILTNKPARVSREILERMNLAKHFRVIYGGNSFETKKPGPEGLLRTLEEFSANPEETLLVGDSPVDIETARNAGVWACGVTYGFNSHRLGEAPPDLSVDNLEELADWIESQ